LRISGYVPQVTERDPEKIARAVRNIYENAWLPYFDARAFDAKGDGTTDDTKACQACIDAAAEVGGIAFFPEGKYKTTSALTATQHVTIRGVGYQSDSGSNYYPDRVDYAPVPSDIRCTVFLPGSHNCFEFTTSEAVVCEFFQISFGLTTTGSGYIGIAIECDGLTPNTSSVIRDVMVTNCDVGFDLETCFEYLIYHCITHFAWINSVVQRCSTVFAGGGSGTDDTPHISDSIIEGCQFWSGAIDAHIWIRSGNIPRIIGNKIAQGAPNVSSGILIEPNLAIEQHLEPGAIVGNTIEGQTWGIKFDNADNEDALASQIAITGNQIWVGEQAIVIENAHSAEWVHGLTISGNSLFTNGGSAVPIIELAGCGAVGVTGNVFGRVSGTAIAVDIGSNATNITQFGNVFHTSVTGSLIDLNDGTWTASHSAGTMTVSGVMNISSAGQTTAFTTTSTTATATAYQASSNSYAGNVLKVNVNTAAATTWNFLLATSDFDGTPDNEFILRGDGTMLSDNAAATPADYAEFFEWEDGNPDDEDRVGHPVVLVNGKIRIATPVDHPGRIIGIVSARPAFVGDAAPFHWTDKYLKDKWGRELKEPYTVTDVEYLDGEKWVVSTLATDRFGEGEEFERNGTRYRVIKDARTLDRDKNDKPFMRSILNPEWDPAREYIPREDRKEWVWVGLIGKLRVHAGAPSNPRWEMHTKGIADGVDLWLVI
jgi:hypothetical protein